MNNDIDTTEFWWPGRMKKASKTLGKGLAATSLAFACSCVVACGETGEEDAIDGTSAGLSGNGVDMTYDEHLAEVAKQVPGFGGMFLDENGVLQVYMTDTSRAATSQRKASIETTISNEVFGGDAMEHQGMEIRKGKYDFLQLKRWHDAMSGMVLGLPGTVFTDIDDAKNRLVIGVEDPGAARAVLEDYADRMSVPRQAVIIKKAEPVKPELRDLNRPLVGGVQTRSSPGNCTLGLAATNANFLPGFITNSHCTITQGGVESTTFHQPIVSGSTNLVGTEITDPTHFSGGACPAGRICRYSDSAFIRLAAGVASTRGDIARPPLNSTNWNGTSLYNNVSNGRGTQAMVGDTVIKVGRTTGRTQGTVQAVCANYNVSSSNITQLCQSQASYSSAGGDSGSPVFSSASPFPRVHIRGIHWGSGGVFSPSGNIQRSDELGLLILF